MNGVRQYEPVNWQHIALTLRTKFRGLQRVADSLGIDDQTIRRLARGETTEPRYTTGVRLLELYKTVQSPIAPTLTKG